MVQTQVVRLGGSLSAEVLHGIAQIVAGTLGDGGRVEVRESPPSPIASPITDAAAVAGLLATIVKALLEFKNWMQARGWDDVRIQETIEATLARDGISNYQIAEIRNPGALKGQGTGPCTVLVRSGARAFQLNVFLDGTVITFQLEPSSRESKPTDLIGNG